MKVIITEGQEERFAERIRHYQMQTEKGTIIKKSPGYGVGKQMGDAIYVHKSAEDIIPIDILENGKDYLPYNFHYEIIKYNKKNGNISFIDSPDWNIAPEPIVGDIILVKGDNTLKFIKQKSPPQIYHHKWLFVRDDYEGFDVEKSKERSKKWLSIPDIEYNKIGYKNYWDNNILPLLENDTTDIDYTDIDPAEIEKANKSSRSSGAVGPNAVTPRAVLQYIETVGGKDPTILDFGAGKDAKHTYTLRDMGLNVTAHDFHSNLRDDHHDTTALEKKYDIVFASNVLNVQGSENMFRKTITDVLSTLKDSGVFIANFPASPRYHFQTAIEAKEILKDYFDIDIIYGTDTSKTSSPVWIMGKLKSQSKDYWG